MEVSDVSHFSWAHNKIHFLNCLIFSIQMYPVLSSDAGAQSWAGQNEKIGKVQGNYEASKSYLWGFADPWPT